MKKNLLFTLAILFFIISGCKKNQDGLPIAGIGSTDSYAPVTKGTAWIYLDSYSGIIDTLSVSMTGGTQLINKKSYYQVASYSKGKGADTSYCFAANHKFYLRQESPTANITIELESLIDTAKAGDTWATSPTLQGNIDGIPAITADTLLEANITKKVNGIMYINVLHTKVNLLYNFGTGFQSQATYEYYFAKGIGMIEEDTSVYGVLLDSKTLLNYNIR